VTSLTNGLALPRATERLLRALPRPSPTFAYTARVLAAAALAIYVAYALELETPYSAGTTVFVLMNISRGAILSKSVWRILGSLVGAVAAVVIVAVFVQAPVLFVLATAAWVGICTFAGALLRYNRGYGAVLAGYTVTLIALGAVNAPDRIFDIAMARLAVVIIGVLATAFIFLITDIGPGRTRLEQGVTSLMARAAAILAQAPQDMVASCHSLAAELGALDQVVEFAAAEDAGFARYQDDLRLAIAEIFAALTGGPHAVTLIHGLADGKARRLMATALTHLAAMKPGARAVPVRQEMRAAIEGLRARAQVSRDAGTLAALSQGVALLSQFDTALAGLQALQDGVRIQLPYRVRFYANPVTALRNGLRAAIAVALAGLFWIISRWPDGGAMVALLGPICALISQTDSAAKSSVQFMLGTVLAAVAALVCAQIVLPQMSGFVLLMVALGPFLTAGILLSRQPRIAMIGIGYLVTFMTLVAPLNPPHFDLSATLNSAVAYVMAGVFAALSFRVLLPPNAEKEALVLAHSIRNAVWRLAKGRKTPPRLVWEHLQHQKILRLSGRLAEFPERRAAALDSATAAVLVGRHLLTLRDPEPSLPTAARAAAVRVQMAFQHLLSAPDQAAATALSESAALIARKDLAAQKDQAPAETPQAVLRLAGVLDDLGSLVAAHRGFFAREAAP